MRQTYVPWNVILKKLTPLWSVIRNPINMQHSSYSSPARLIVVGGAELNSYFNAVKEQCMGISLQLRSMHYRLFP